MTAAIDTKETIETGPVEIDESCGFVYGGKCRILTVTVKITDVCVVVGTMLLCVRVEPCYQRLHIITNNQIRGDE